MPLAVRGRHLFEIFQDAALEVVDVVETEALEKRGGLLAADATGAEHRDLGLAIDLQVVTCPVRELAERGRTGTDRVLEAADLDFVVVACVDHDDVGVCNQRVPVGRLDIGANGHVGVGERLADRDDFAFDAYAEARKGRCFGGGFLVFNVGETRQGTDGLKEAVKPIAGPGQRAVHAFGCDQQRALDGIGLTNLDEMSLHGFEVIERGELVERGDDQRR